MKQFKLRFAKPEESKQIIEWLHANPQNDFDPGILKYPSLQIICSYADDEPMVYLPTQTVKIMESIAVRPGIDHGDAAQALRDCTKAAQLLASAQQLNELYFFSRDEALMKMAENHGFEVLPFKVLRMKLK